MFSDPNKHNDLGEIQAYISQSHQELKLYTFH